MIQRIQSIYLLLAAIAMIVMFFLPIGDFYGDQFYFSFGLKGVSDNTYVEINTLPLTILTAIACLLSFASIFIYRNRPLQIRIIRINLLLQLSLIIVLYFGYIDVITKKVAVTIEYGTAIYFPLIALVLLVLAMRAVMNDDKKVRAADRLR